MDRFTSAIRKSISTENWNAALFMALAMPDICCKFEDPLPHGTGARYRTWFDKYLLPINTSEIMGKTIVFMTADDCWALRCSLLHAASDDVSVGAAADAVKRFRFTATGGHRLKGDYTLTLNVGKFCGEVCDAVDVWAAAALGDPAVRERVDRAIQVGDGPIPA